MRWLAKRVLWTLAAAAVVLVIAGLAVGTLRAANTSARGPVGQPAPDLVVRRLSGGDLSLSSLRGHPVVLNFWASWCVPCRQEAPVLNQAATTYAGRVEFLGVDIQDSEAAARSFVNEEHVPYPVGPLRHGSYRDLGVSAPPETFFIDRNGRVAARVIGPVSAIELALRVAEIEKYVVSRS